MRPYQDLLAFLDIEAGVDSSSDDGDDGDDDIDEDFISDAPEIDSGVSTTSNRHQVNRLEVWNDDAESMVKAIMDRYRGSEGSAWKDQHATDQKKYTEGWKTTVAYLPSVTDGDIWKVAVTPGSELTVVTTIFNKVLALQIDGVDSAFYREGIHGVVYVEARNYGAVLAALKDVNNVWLRYYKHDGGPVDLVPISERLALLTLNIKRVNEVETAPDEQQRFVRIRDRTRYRNRLAIIGSYVISARHALVLVVPRELITVPGARRRVAAPPTLKRDPAFEGEDVSSRPTLLTSDGVDNLQSVTSEGEYLAGLEVRRIDVGKLVYHDIHPTEQELDLFEATRHDDICKLVNNARHLQIRQGEKFEVTQGPWKGFKGIVEDTMATDLDILIRMKGRYSWDNIEVPAEDLLHTGVTGSTTTVKAGPYTGLTGRIHKYLHDEMVILSPDTDAEETIDVRVSDIQRAVDLGDEVEIILGGLRGHAGFYVGPDDAKARIYIPGPTSTAVTASHTPSTAAGSTVSIPFTHIRTSPDTRHVRLTAQWSESGPTPFQLPPNTWSTRDSEAMYTGEHFRGLEVMIVDHPLKGYEGYVVGSCLVKQSVSGSGDGGNESAEDMAMLEFEVNKLNHITCYTTRVSAHHLLEKYSKLPIMEAIHLPLSLRRPEAVSSPVPLPVAMTPLVNGPQSTWEAVAYEYTRDRFTGHDRYQLHWLRNPVMMQKKFQVLVLQTLFDDETYRTDNAIRGYTVVTKALDPWAERVFVKIGDQAHLTTKKVELKKIIPDSFSLHHDERVVVIGPDLDGSVQNIGLIGWVNKCPYELAEGVHMVALAEPPSYAYIHQSNMCRTGAPVMWNGELYN